MLKRNCRQLNVYTDRLSNVLHTLAHSTTLAIKCFIRDTFGITELAHDHVTDDVTNAIDNTFKAFHNAVGSAASPLVADASTAPANITAENRSIHQTHPKLTRSMMTPHAKCPYSRLGAALRKILPLCSFQMDSAHAEYVALAKSYPSMTKAGLMAVVSIALVRMQWPQSMESLHGVLVFQVEGTDSPFMK